MTALRSYVLNEIAEIIVSEGENLDYLYFGVTTEDSSGHFTLTRKNAEALEGFLREVIEEAGGCVEDRAA